MVNKMPALMELLTTCIVHKDAIFTSLATEACVTMHNEHLHLKFEEIIYGAIAVMNQAQYPVQQQTPQQNTVLAPLNSIPFTPAHHDNRTPGPIQNGTPLMSGSTYRSSSTTLVNNAHKINATTTIVHPTSAGMPRTGTLNKPITLTSNYHTHHQQPSTLSRV